MFVHPTAIVDAKAQCEEGVLIGPYCVVGPDVVLGKNVQLLSHVVVEGNTTIGEGTVVYPFATLGHRPQDLKYNGEPSELRIGVHNQIREHVTMHTGTQHGRMMTVVGDHCLFMAGSHVAHDCIVGDRVVMANQATLGGHVTVGDRVIIGGLAAILQFTRIGQCAIVSGTAGVADDVIPFGSVIGSRARLSGLNIIGLERNNFSKQDISALRKAYSTLFVKSSGTMMQRLAQLGEELLSVPAVKIIHDFISAAPTRSFCMPRAREDWRPQEGSSYGKSAQS